MDASAQLASYRNEKGMVLIYATVLMLVLLGFLGLAVDTGHLLKVRNELQNAADAAALKGAWHLYTRPTDPGVPPTLQWGTALAKAQELTNSSDNQALADAAVSVGYWNLTWDGSTAHELQPTTIVPGSNDVPAVQVVVARSAGNNGGPVTSFLMQLAGKETVAVTSKAAVAVSGFPGLVAPGRLFPMALSNCMTDQYFSQNPLPDPPPRIIINSAFSGGGAGCYTGQWTSFDTDSNSVPTIRGLMDTGNTTPLKVGDSTWIEPGVKNTIYKDLADWLPEGGKDVLMAVVDNASSDLSSKGQMTITGFATFHIDGADNGSDPYVYGHFIDFFTTPPGTLPGGAASNTVTLPILVQ
jgi:Flp pilus assembly protein TadG